MIDVIMGVLFDDSQDRLRDLRLFKKCDDCSDFSPMCHGDCVSCSKIYGWYFYDPESIFYNDKNFRSVFNG